LEIINLINELERLKATTHDVILPSQLIQAVEDQGALKIDLKEHGRYPLNKWGANQLAEKAGIPVLYFDKMLENGLVDLTADNVNRWFKHDAATNRLVRVADGKVRAVLSDRYRMLDNYDVAIQAMDRASNFGAQVQNCELTDKRMYLRFILPHKQEDIKPGDAGIPGLQISNSEVGDGAFRVEPFLYRMICKNGLVGDHKLWQVHIGGKNDIGEILKDDTKRKLDEALFGQVRDLIDATFDGRLLHRQIETLRLAEGIKFETKQSITEITDVTARDLSLSDERKNDLLRYFAKEGDNLFGLVNGITRLAQDTKDFDERERMERYAGEQLEKKVVKAGLIAPMVVAK
jgi:hypothetical protein